jgi:hypothetical protein
MSLQTIADYYRLRFFNAGSLYTHKTQDREKGYQERSGGPVILINDIILFEVDETGYLDLHRR